MVKIVGILNITPDSFSDGGLFTEPAQAIMHATKLFSDGASYVDIGAESTRPNATPLSDDEEWQRLEPILTKLILLYPGKISVDSYHPTTIRRAFEIGPIMINDVTGLMNPEMVNLVCALQARVVISHLPNMDIQLAHRTVPVHEIDEVTRDLLDTAVFLEYKGLPRNNIILDPGIGFGKSQELNIQLLKFAEQVPKHDVMIGYSRKRFLGERRMEIEPNIEAGTIAIAHGAKFLRVHDVAGHVKFLT